MDNSTDRVVIYQMLTRLFGNKNTTNKPHGTIEENGVGKFNDISNTALRSLAMMGITHVWYTGVIEHALLTDYTKFGILLDDADIVKGRAGSPYAIKDYYDVNPDLAFNIADRMKEFENLVNRTHAEGLKVLIDFVPNHVARAYWSDAKPEGVKDLGENDDTSISFTARNNFYYLPGQTFVAPKDAGAPPNHYTFSTRNGRFEETPAKATGNDHFTASPDKNDWFETVKLNYGVDIQNNRETYFDPLPDTWLKMKDILSFWANKKVDGFRCDMAEMVPVEFWQWVIPQIKKIDPSIIFIAEIYTPEAYRKYINIGHFDYLYDKVQLYDTLRLLMNGERTTKDIQNIQESLSDISRHRLHFLENHDEQRIASRQFAGDAWKAVPAMVVSATLDTGAVMIYFGQEVGEPAAGTKGFGGDDGRTSIFDYGGVLHHQQWMNTGAFDGGLLHEGQKQLRMFYSDLLNLAAHNKALTLGGYCDITQPNLEVGNIDERIVVYLRFSSDERLLILASFSDKEQAVKVHIPAAVAAKIGIEPSSVTLKARDLLWRKTEVGLDEALTLTLVIKPFSSYIFKIE